MSVDTLSEASLPHSVPETVLHSVAGTVLDISDLSDGSGDPESGGSDAVLEVSVPARTAVINWLAHLKQLHNVAQPLREEQMLVYESPLVMGLTDAELASWLYDIICQNVETAVFFKAVSYTHLTLPTKRIV